MNMFPTPPSFHEGPPSQSSSARQAPQQQQQQQNQQHQQQQQQHHQQQVLLMNGINGAGNLNGGVAVAAPAAQQAELNYIYNLVEDLSRQLSENRRATEEIVAGLGRVRNRARLQGLSNEELINVAADGLNAQEQNLDALVSLLTESLEKAKHSRDANAQLLSQYATAVASMLKQFHEYKAKHVADVAAWHRSYRSQLAEARAENSRLREQIWEMQDRASKANRLLREFRRKHDEDTEKWDQRVDEVATKQELRFWKRMAMPDKSDDDPFWSDDDDIIDTMEKERLKEIERKLAQEHLAGDQQEGEEHGGQIASPDPGMVGGVPMQRDQSSSMAQPIPPPRPSSATSSTGSSGQ